MNRVLEREFDWKDIYIQKSLNYDLLTKEFLEQEKKIKALSDLMVELNKQAATPNCFTSDDDEDRGLRLRTKAIADQMADILTEEAEAE
jgi:replication fork clamp-binding protein CrfC